MKEPRVLVGKAGMRNVMAKRIWIFHEGISDQIYQMLLKY